MLHEFLSRNREEIISRCREKLNNRKSPQPTADELEYGVPLFLDQLIKTLQLEQRDDLKAGFVVSGPAGGSLPAQSEMEEMAALHGGELMKRGFTVDQVVHDYGDLCQAVTDLAFEVNEDVEVHEFRSLNRCLDNAIAMAVREYTYQRDFVSSEQQAQGFNVRLGFFAHELRNFLNTATLAVSAIKEGDLGVNGATGAVLDRALVGMRSLIDRSLADVRMTAELPLRSHIFSLADFINELKLSANLEAQVKGCVLIVSVVDSSLAVDADRDLLLSAVGNLLQNAFKFTKHGTEVSLAASAVGNRILIDVEDQGEGLPGRQAETMFVPFTQGSMDKSGLGLGLSIARRSVEANRGVLSARNKMGGGCVFTVDLPKLTLPA